MAQNIKNIRQSASASVRLAISNATALGSGYILRHICHLPLEVWYV